MKDDSEEHSCISLIGASLNDSKNKFFRISLEIYTATTMAIGIFDKNKLIEDKFIAYTKRDDFQ